MNTSKSVSVSFSLISILLFIFAQLILYLVIDVFIHMYKSEIPVPHQQFITSDISVAQVVIILTYMSIVLS